VSGGNDLFLLHDDDEDNPEAGADANRQFMNRTIMDSRAENTKKLYGNNFDNPARSAGAVGEFYKWCRAGPLEKVNGKLTSADKKKKHCHPTETLVTQYFQQHLLQRKVYNPKTRQFDLDKPLGPSALDNQNKGLIAFYRYRANEFRGGPDKYRERYGPPPGENKYIKALIKAQLTKLAIVRRENHLPRGKAALLLEGYTEDQNRQLFEFGLSDDIDIGPVGYSKARLVHTHHTLAHNYALRFDDRQKTLLSQFCCMDPPGKMGEKASKLLILVMDWRKTVRDGTKQMVYALRHKEDPMRCTWFAFSLELYCQIFIENMPLGVDDFRPQVVEEEDSRSGNLYHPWYDRFFFYGNSKSKKGQASVPQAHIKCHYDNVRKLFNTVYRMITPAILCWHVLHLDRGEVARKADADNVCRGEIGSAGGWRATGSLDNHYLTHVPMKFVRWVCGYSETPVPTENICLRSVLVPPESLWKRVYPFYDEVLNAMEQEPHWKEVGEKDTTLKGFLEMLEYSAKYFLQDCAVLHPRMSQHPIFQTELLTSQEFIDFKKQLEDEMLDEIDRRAEFDEEAGRAHLTPEIASFIKRTYEILAGPFAAFVSTAGAAANSLTTCCCHQAAKAASQATQAILPKSPAVITGTQRMYGPDCPYNIVPAAETPMERAQLQAASQVVVPLVARTKDTNEWPVATPNWAHIQMFTNHESVESFVTEYLFGLNNLPALRELELKYGPDAVTKAFKETLDGYKADQKNYKALPPSQKQLAVPPVKPQKWKAWRSTGTGRKEWCNRKPIYAFLEDNKGREEEALTEFIQKEFSSELLKYEKTASQPGKTILGMAVRKFTMEKDGFQARQEVAKAKRAKRKRNALGVLVGEEEEHTEEEATLVGLTVTVTQETQNNDG